MKSWLFPERGRKSFVQPPFWSQPDSLSLGSTWSAPDKERIEGDFLGYVRGAYKANGIVFSCILARQSVFSQARFGWRDFSAQQPGKLTQTPELGLLRRPWLNGRTGDLLARMEPDASLAGNFYCTVVDARGRVGRAATGPARRIRRLRPDWVTLVIGSPSENPYDIRARVVAVVYEPPVGGGYSVEPTILLPEEVCHYAPIPDPEMQWRGMSWLTPVLREIEADSAGTKHKRKFFENGAQLQTVISLDKDISVEAFDAFRERFEASHRGAENAYRTLFLGGGADATVVGTDLRNLDFKSVQGGGETRIAAAAGAHPVIVGLSEGLAGSSLNAGNFSAARRLFADKTMRPLWECASSSLQTLVPPPGEDIELWYDTADVAFLREDQKDAAAIMKENMLAIESGVRAGFKPETVVSALTAGDLSLMEHTGLYSVQLLPPDETGQAAQSEPDPDADPSTEER